jgi:hypothetical protein
MADTEQTQTDDTAATTDQTAGTTDQTTDATDTELGENGKSALEKERARAKDAEKRAKEAEKRLADIETAQQKAAEDEAKAKGEFEKLAGDRLTALDKAKIDLKTAIEERDALKERLQAREDQDKAEIAAWLKDHKGAVDEFLDYYPGADAPADAQMAWYVATRPKVEKRVTDPVRGNGRSPEAANGRDARADEAARNAQALQTTRSW